MKSRTAQGALITTIFNGAGFLSWVNLRQVIPVAPALFLRIWDVATLSGTITAATNATPIAVTSAAHGLNTNDTVTISGVLGNPAANGTFNITVSDANTFTLQTAAAANVAGNGTYASGGTWIKAPPKVAIVSSTDATPIVLTTTTHGFAVGDAVNVAGHLTNTNANGTFTISAKGATTLTLQSTAGTGGGAGGATGTVTKLPTRVFPVPAGESNRETNTEHVIQTPWSGEKIANSLSIQVSTTPDGVTGPTAGQEPIVDVDYNTSGGHTNLG